MDSGVVLFVIPAAIAYLSVPSLPKTSNAAVNSTMNKAVAVYVAANTAVASGLAYTGYRYAFFGWQGALLVSGGLALALVNNVAGSEELVGKVMGVLAGEIGDTTNASANRD